MRPAKISQKCIYMQITCYLTGTVEVFWPNNDRDSLTVFCFDIVISKGVSSTPMSDDRSTGLKATFLFQGVDFCISGFAHFNDFIT